MPSPNHPQDATLQVKPASPGTPQAQLGPPLDQINNVLELTSLNANGSHPARIANVAHANLTSSVNRSAQNAVANQQAHTQLNLTLVGKMTNKVQNLEPGSARSVVEILTDNDLAETLISLKAVVASLDKGHPVTPFNWQRLLVVLKKVLAEIEMIETVNSRLHGDGTIAHPYSSDNQPIYVKAPVTLGFPGWHPQQLDLEVLRKLFSSQQVPQGQ
jgi:hypothetical protein